MSVPLWVAELACAFWEAAAMREPFPRALQRPIRRALKMSVTLLPRLCLGSVCAWLADSGLSWSYPGANRRLRACLVAWQGWGYVFLDQADTQEERRFSLAHELAHFLRHYWQPRRAAVRRLGEQIVEVLDGRRAPTAAERLRGLLADTPLGYHVHLMERDSAGQVTAPGIRTAEWEADRLGYELLAPAADVLADTDAGTLREVLGESFGLPPLQAARYATLLVPPSSPADPLLARLRRAAKK
jgi:uncharacterized protein DUF955